MLHVARFWMQISFIIKELLTVSRHCLNTDIIGITKILILLVNAQNYASHVNSAK